MEAYPHPVSIQRLFAILVALSMLFAPAVARAGEMASAASHHGMKMMKAGHCESAPSGSSDHEKMAGKICCISMCMAVAIQSPASATELAQAAPPSFAIPSFQVGSPGELATPPPKFS